jgi:hypothetical protein
MAVPPVLIGMAAIAELGLAAIHGQTLPNCKSGLASRIVPTLILVLICNI